MQIIKWAIGQGGTIQLDKEEAKELRYLVDKALTQGVKKMGKYIKKTDWVCNHCRHINDVYAHHCDSCMDKKQGNEKRL